MPRKKKYQKKKPRTVKNTNKNHKFIELCKNGNLQQIKIVIETAADDETFDINNTDINGWTGFLHACKNGHFYVVKYLEKMGCDVYFITPNNENACTIAFENNQFEIINYLFQMKTLNTKQWTWFTHSCEFGEFELVKFLMKTYPDCIYDTGTFGKTPLIYASENGHVNIVEVLLKSDCDIDASVEICTNDISLNLHSRNSKSILYISAFKYACINGHLDVVEFLIKNQCHICGKGFEYAVINNHCKIVDYLTQITTISVRHDRAFLTCCIQGNLDMLTYLHTIGVDIYAKNDYGKNGLMLACEHNHVQIVKFLIGVMHQHEIYETDEDDINCFATACENNSFEVVEFLIQSKKFKLEEVKCYFGSCVETSCKNGYVDLLKLLMQHGCNVTKVDENNISCLHWAFRYFFYCSENLNVPKTMELIDILIGANLDINERDIFTGSTGLIWACKKDCVPLVKLLVSKNADVHVQNHDGDTALIIASESKYVNLVQILIYQNANVNVRNSNGFTPLMQACKNKNFSVVKELICMVDEKAVTEAFQLALNSENTFQCTFQKYNISIFMLEHGASIESLKVFSYGMLFVMEINSRIREIHAIENAIKAVLGKEPNLVCDQICKFTNGLKNLDLAAIGSHRLATSVIRHGDDRHMLGPQGRRQRQLIDPMTNFFNLIDFV